MADSVIVKVALAARSYDVVIGSGALKSFHRHLPQALARRRFVIVTDETVARHHLAALKAELPDAPAIVLPSGETTKSFAHLERVVEDLIGFKLERGDALVAFGGGVIGDLAGFAAAIVKRGIQYIQIPTTLLSQVDSSVGGKTAINSRHGKNLIGAFHQPRLVLADTALLDTLDPRELRAGYAEVVKYGLISDTDFFAWLESNGAAVLAGDGQARIKAIARAVEMKAEIVAEDETETGRRALLNLGHTFGHAFETAAGLDSTLLHGEAVALGMVYAFAFSERLGLSASEATTRLKRHLTAVGLPATPGELPGGMAPPEKLAEFMTQDKKVENGKLVFILTRGIGEAFIAKDVAMADVMAFLKSL